MPWSSAILIGSGVLSCIVWVVGPQNKLCVCIAHRCATSGLCLLYVCACGISFYIPNYCKPYQQSNHQSAHSGCHLPIYIPFLLGIAPNQGIMWNKWKNHFSEMKGDIGMSRHEKEGEQEDA